MGTGGGASARPPGAGGALNSGFFLGGGGAGGFFLPIADARSLTDMDLSDSGGCCVPPTPGVVLGEVPACAVGL